MTSTETTVTPDATADQGDVTPQDTTTPAEVAATDIPDPEGADKLGDAGKKALDAMKEREKAARAATRERDAEIERLRAEIAAQTQTAEERAREEARRELRVEADARANERILKAEIRAVATAKLADPTDALRFLDLKDFDVSADGEVDADRITEAINDLITARPYLGKPTGPNNPKPDPNQGARRDSRTADDVAYESFFPSPKAK